MKIIEFRAENVKKLSVVEHRPDPGKPLIIVAGKNGVGKSSVLDAIEMALGGETHVPAKPVRKGQDKGSVDLDLGTYRVRRTFTAGGGGSLTVWNKDGLKQPSPQGILDDLFNQHTFDPMAFKNAKPAERTQMLEKLLGLNFAPLEAEKQTAYDERTLVNREIKSAEALIKANPRHPDAPAEEQSTATVLEEQKKASAQNNQNLIVRGRVTQCMGQMHVQESAVIAAVRQVDDLTLEIERLQKKLGVAEVDLQEKQQKFEGMKAELAAAQQAVLGLADVDLGPFTQKLRDLEAVNEQVRKNREIDRYVAHLTELRRKAEKFSDKIDAIERRKKELIAAAKFPVAGLGFSDANEVTFSEIPFDQVNTADQLRISVAIGLVLNPELRVLLIRQGNDLDEDNLRLIGELAAGADAQVWLERVSTAGDVSLILEDGHIQGESANLEVPTETGPAAVETEKPTELKLQ